MAIMDADEIFTTAVFPGLGDASSFVAAITTNNYVQLGWTVAASIICTILIVIVRRYANGRIDAIVAKIKTHRRNARFQGAYRQPGEAPKLAGGGYVQKFEDARYM